MRTPRFIEPVAGFLDGRDDEAPGVPFLPWSLLGVGVFIAWLCCTHLPHLFVFAEMGRTAETTVDYAMRVGDIGTFVAVVLLGPRVGRIGDRHGLCIAAALACSLASGALPFAVRAGVPLPVLAVMAVVAGFGGAVLFLLWAQVYAGLGPARCVFFGGCACIVAGAVALAVFCLQPVAADVAIGILPLASFCMVVTSLTRFTGPVPGAGVSLWRPKHGSVPWKLVVLLALAGFASGFAGSLLVQVDGIGAVHRIVSTVLFGCLLLGMFFVSKGRPDIRVLARFTLPLVVVSLALIPLCGTSAGELVSFLVKLSYVAFALFVLLVLAEVVWRRGIESAPVFACARAASEAAMFAGILLRRWMRDAGMLDNQTMLWIITLVGLVVVVGCVLLWNSERSVNDDWGSAARDDSGARVLSTRERLCERCAAIAAEHGLTPREQEVYLMVVEGKPLSEIEQSLFLSRNTLKTHLRHLYAKLGVHSREEAAALAAETTAS